MKTDLYNQKAQIIGEIELSEKVFGLAPNHDLIKQVVEAQIANSRQVIAHTKGRGEVHGGGRKPWRQKGTGRARHGSIRSPIWKGGGVVFGPTKERNFKKGINKKMKRTALFMALSSKVGDKELMILENLKLETPKTKEALKAISTLTAKLPGYKETKRKKDSVLFVMPVKDREFLRAAQNLPFVTVSEAANLNTKEVLAKKYLVLLKDALSVIEQTFKL